MPAFNKWKSEEIEFLKEKFNEGFTDKEISELMIGRSAISIKSQIKYLRQEGKLPAERIFKNHLDKRLTPLEARILEFIKKSDVKVSDGDLSRHCDKCKETIVKACDSLVKKGYMVEYDHERHEVKLHKDITKWKAQPVNLDIYKNYLKFGLISDIHLGSKCQQLTLLHKAYEIFDQEQVAFVNHCGDTSEGNGRLYPNQMGEIFLPNNGKSVFVNEALDYVIEHYPKLSGGRRTHMISGSHDESWLKYGGFDFLRALAKEREDIIYEGSEQAEFILKKARFLLQHPSGGVAYARSYHLQRRMEQLAGYILSIATSTKEIKLKLPKIVAMGHWHISLYIYYMGMHIFAVPCLQSQTPYLKRKGLMPSVGFYIIEIQYDENSNVMKITPHYYNWNHLIKEKDY